MSPSIKLKSIGKEVGFSDSVSIDFSVTTLVRPTPGYGSGILEEPGILSFFDAFDIKGDETGTWDSSLTLPLEYGSFSYGYGYEYTTLIREDQPADVLSVRVSISPASTYEVFIDISGPGRLHLFYNPSTFGYGTTFEDGTNYLTYRGITDSSGNLDLKISVPYSFKELQWFQEYLKDNESIAHIYSPKGPGVVTITASVADKILDHDNLRVIGTLIESESQIKIKSTGSLDI